MNIYRKIALAALVVGAIVLTYGIWNYYDSRAELRIGDTSLVIEDAEASPAIWIGGAVILLAGTVMVGARSKRA